MIRRLSDVTVCIAMVAALVVFAPQASAQAGVTLGELTLSSSSVFSGDTVLVSGSFEYPGNLLTGIVQCPADVDLTFQGFIDDCELLKSPSNPWSGTGVVVEGTPRTGSGEVFDCYQQECLIAIAGLTVEGVFPNTTVTLVEVLSAQITVLLDPYFTASPTTGLLDSESITIDSDFYLDSVPGAVAFSMQCAFRTTAPGFFCGPTGDVVANFTGAYQGELAVRVTFAGGGEVLRCGDNAICFAVVAVIDGADWSFIDGAGVPISFAGATGASLDLAEAGQVVDF